MAQRDNIHRVVRFPLIWKEGAVLGHINRDYRKQRTEYHDRVIKMKVELKLVLLDQSDSVY